MGLDTNYQSLPPDCPLLERSKRDTEFGSCLEFFSRYASLPQAQMLRYKMEPIVMDFIFEAKKVAAKYPGIENRNLFGERRWDMLYYLLSENRRRSEEKDWAHWAEKAIFGGTPLHEGTITSIGFPIRYLTPEEVLQVLEKLENTSLHVLHHHWNPLAMSEAAVYKISGEEGEESFRWLVESFEALKTFYAEGAQHNEGVLAFMS